jgi:N-methylhydantoinase B
MSIAEPPIRPTGALTGSVDPVTFEIIRNKLRQVMEEGMDALKNVSGSPTTNEGHDLMVSLYTADGDLMMGGVGFLHHLTSAAQAVRHILSEFSEDPGIDDGDVYMLNDSYTAALHPPDIYIISPVYWEGVRRGFVANFVHATDIGAVDPGGFSPNARNSYQEGFVTKGLKIVDRGKVRRDVVETYLNQVREPGLVALDLKSQLAANHAAIERMHALYREFGPDTVEAVSDALVEQSDRLLRARLSELPDGTWRHRQYVDWPDRLHVIQATMTKTGDSLHFDYSGSGPQSELGVNDSYWSTLGATFAPVYPLLAWDLTWNQGLMRAVTVEAPEGTIVNCVKPAPVSVATVAVIKVINDVASLLIGRMLAASEAYRDRAMAVWDGVHSAISMVGADASGEGFIAYSTDAFAGAGGARATRDGIDVGGEIPNGFSRWANAETHELGAPLLYNYRRVVTDSGGPGKYRGGVSHEFALSPHGSAPEGITMIVMTKGLTAPLSIGISGGMPGCLTGSSIHRGANLDEMPVDLASTRAESVEVFQWGDVLLGVDDLFYHRFQGGGGYGDPIDREISAVAIDVANRMVSVGAAHEIYGVALTASGSPDERATLERRLAIRAERLGRDVEPEHGTRRRPPSSGRPLSEYLQRTDDGVQCTWCGGHINDGGRPWKLDAVLLQGPLSHAGPLRESADGLVLRSFVCQHCGTLLESDVALPDDELVHDEVVSWRR